MLLLLLLVVEVLSFPHGSRALDRSFVLANVGDTKLSLVAEATVGLYLII